MRIGFTKTPHQDYVVRLKQAIRADGHEALDFPNVVESDPSYVTVANTVDIAVVWGVAKAKRLQAMGAKNVLIMERGYLGDRHNWVSLGWDDLNGQANFYNSYVPADRWDKYWRGQMQQWKTTGNNILVCGQVMNDQSLSDCIDYKAWLKNTCITLMNNDENVVFRGHPLETEDYGLSKDIYISTDKDIYGDLNRCKAMVTWSSTASVIAAYNGVPTFVFSKYAMTNEVSSNDLNKIVRPDRYDWGRKIAYTQWNLDELSNGTAWYHIKTRFYY